MNNSKDNKVTGSKFIGFLKKHKTLCIFLAIIATLTVAYGILEFNFQQKVNTVKNEVMRVEKTVVQPSGGRNIENSITLECPHYIDSTGWVDINCPNASQSWYVAVDKDMSLTSCIKDTFQKMGYINHGEVFADEESGGSIAYTGKLAIHVGVEKAKSSNEPYKLPDSKKWIILTANAYTSSYMVGQK